MIHAENLLQCHCIRLDFLTNHDAIRKNEELHIWGKGTEYETSCHHDATEDGHRTSTEVVHTGTADWTWE